MTRKQALAELIAKVEAGFWGSAVDGYAILAGLSGDNFVNANKAYFGSLDASKALHKAVLPGWGWRIGQCHVSDDAWVSAPDDSMAPDGQEWSAYTDIDQRPPGNTARAWLLAILKALHAQEGGA